MISQIEIPECEIRLVLHSEWVQATASVDSCMLNLRNYKTLNQQLLNLSAEHNRTGMPSAVPTTSWVGQGQPK